MSSMLNFYPKKFKPDLFFIGLLIHCLPQSIPDHLLALDLDENPDVLARKADQLFQSYQASSLNLLTGDPTPPVFALRPKQQLIYILFHNLPLFQDPSCLSPPSEVSICHLLHLLVPQHTETRPRSVSNPAPGRKTSWPAGRNVFLPAVPRPLSCTSRTLFPPGIFW